MLIAHLRNIVIIPSDTIGKAISVRKRYLELFEANQRDDIRMYNLLHKEATGLSDTRDTNWLTESQRTGEFFPGRPQIRPSMNFGQASPKENNRSCRKNYVKSESRSLGILTVQCVSRYPKLIGVSVIRECEGMSTPLSILRSKFKTLLQVCFYDKAYNMSRLITLRFLWMYEYCITVFDRFHYQ